MFRPIASDVRTANPHDEEFQVKTSWTSLCPGKVLPLNFRIRLGQIPNLPSLAWRIGRVVLIITIFEEVCLYLLERRSVWNVL